MPGKTSGLPGTRKGIKIGWLLLGDLNTGSSRIHGINIHNFLLEHGIESVILQSSPRMDRHLALTEEEQANILAAGFDALIFQKVFDEKAIAFATKARDIGIKTIFLLSDNHSTDMVTAVDKLVVTSEYLKSSFDAKYQIDSQLIEDAIEHITDTPKIHTGKDILKLIWVGQKENWETLDIIRTTLVGHPEFDLHTVSNHPESDTPWRLATINREIVDGDIAVIPALGSAWGLAKSNNRLTMFMSFGLPVVASDIPAYRKIIRQGENGFLVSTEQEWLQVLNLLKDVELRQRIGNQARADVISSYGIENIGNQWIAFLKSILCDKLSSIVEVPGEALTLNRKPDDGRETGMTKDPAISVVMSVYNGERYLREAVDSILTQTYTDFEFIIINDGSTDQTGQILKAYDDPRIVLIDQENVGLTKSLNKGIALSRGRYIARQDADDISMPERLAKEVAFLEEHPSVGLLGSRFEFINVEGQVLRQSLLPLENDELQEKLTSICQYCHPTVMVRKAVLDQVGGYREFFKYAQDYDLWLRISEVAQIANLPDFLVRWRESSDAISSQKIVQQSLYAGAAASMARQRRTEGSDELQQGKIPSFPRIADLSEDLHRKLSDFYSAHPDLLPGLLNTDSDSFRFILTNICVDRSQLRNHVRKGNERLGKIYANLDTANAELKERYAQLEQKEKDSRTKDAEIELKKGDLRTAAAQLAAKDEEIRGKNQKLGDLGTLLAKYEKLTRNKEKELRDKEAQIAARDARLNDRQDALIAKQKELDRVRETLVGQEAIIANRDDHISQLEQHVAAKQSEVDLLLDRFHDLEKSLLTKQQELSEALAAAAGKREVIAQLQATINAKDQRIEDLLNSMSWKVTSPLRSVLDIFQR